MSYTRGSDRLTEIVTHLGAVRREGVTDQLVKKLKSLVVRGLVVSGQRLPPEREFAQMLGVSRPSLRGALKALQIMGVLEIRHGSGTYMTRQARQILNVSSRVLIPPRGPTQAELFELRRALEAECAACAALRATPQDLSKMRRELAAMKTSIQFRDQKLYRKHDMAFHLAIAAASGNPLFVRFLKATNKILFRELWRKPLLINRYRSMQGHMKIFQRIEAKDPAGARTVMVNTLLYPTYFANGSKQANIRFIVHESSRKQRFEFE